MDPALHQAVKGGIAPLHEYLLQGSIVDTAKDVLIHRLRGLCDNSESPPETFSDHEMVFQLRGSATQSPVNVHLRHSLVQTEVWHLRYVGSAELGDKSRQTLVRSCIDIGVSDTVVKFLQEMGFKLEYEFVSKGFFFHKGRMKVMVSKLFKMNQPGVTDSLEPISMSCLVELSVVAPAGQEQIGEDMKNFSEQLKPFREGGSSSSSADGQLRNERRLLLDYLELVSMEMRLFGGDGSVTPQIGQFLYSW